jgi:hypothetical protein
LVGWLKKGNGGGKVQRWEKVCKKREREREIPYYPTDRNVDDDDDVANEYW